jgi:hypothetical protein
VAFSGAHEVLGRFVKGAKRELTSASDAQRAKAAKLDASIEKAAAEQVAALTKSLPKKLALDGGDWLGNLVLAREDLRGLAAMEALVKKLDYDALAKRHAGAAEAIFKAWYGSKPPADVYTTIVEGLPDAFLFEGFPVELRTSMEEWHAKAKDLGLKKPVLAKFENYERWKQGWTDGSREREQAWRSWRAPDVH